MYKLHYLTNIKNVKVSLFKLVLSSVTLPRENSEFISCNIWNEHSSLFLKAVYKFNKTLMMAFMVTSESFVQINFDTLCAISHLVSVIYIFTSSFYNWVCASCCKW